MTRTKKSRENTTGLFAPLLIIFVSLVALYALAVFIIMPLYTRHWQRVQVPEVTHMSQTAARKIIASKNLAPVNGELKFDDDVPPGYVSFQNPIGNSFVKKGRRIYLNISKGKRPVFVPKLVGMNLRDAEFMIAQAQLELGVISHDFDRYYPENVVMDQAIDPETEIMAGSVIDITVSLGEEPEEIYVPNLYGKTMEEAELLVKKSLLTMGQVNFRESESDPNQVIFQSLEVGERAGKGDTVNIVLSKLKKSGEEALPW